MISGQPVVDPVVPAIVRNVGSSVPGPAPANSAPQLSASVANFAWNWLIPVVVPERTCVTLWLPEVERQLHRVAGDLGLALDSRAWPGEKRSLLRMVQLVSGLSGQELATVLGCSVTEVAFWVDREPAPAQAHARIQQLWLHVRANDHGSPLANRMALHRVGAGGETGIALAAAGNWVALAEHIRPQTPKSTPLPQPFDSASAPAPGNGLRAGDSLRGLVGGTLAEPGGKAVVAKRRR